MSSYCQSPLAASRPDLEQRIREDKDFLTFCAESIQLPSGDTALVMQCSTRLSHALGHSRAHALGHSRAQPCLNRKSVQAFGTSKAAFAMQRVFFWPATCISPPGRPRWHMMPCAQLPPVQSSSTPYFAWLSQTSPRQDNFNAWTCSSFRKPR